MPYWWHTGCSILKWTSVAPTFRIKFFPNWWLCWQNLLVIKSLLPVTTQNYSLGQKRWNANSNKIILIWVIDHYCCHFIIFVHDCIYLCTYLFATFLFVTYYFLKNVFPPQLGCDFTWWRAYVAIIIVSKTCLTSFEIKTWFHRKMFILGWLDLRGVFN